MFSHLIINKKMLIFIPFFDNYLLINQKNRFFLTDFMHERHLLRKSPFRIYVGRTCDFNGFIPI